MFCYPGDHLCNIVIAFKAGSAVGITAFTQLLRHRWPLQRARVTVAVSPESVVSINAKNSLPRALYFPSHSNPSIEEQISSPIALCACRGLHHLRDASKLLIVSRLLICRGIS